jgi:hypothetical protein
MVLLEMSPGFMILALKKTTDNATQAHFHLLTGNNSKSAVSRQDSFECFWDSKEFT